MTPAERERIRKWAVKDAIEACPKLGLLPGKDGNFNWFQVGERIAEASERMAWHHDITREGRPQSFAVYHEAFSDTITSIIHDVEEQTNAEAQPWKHL
jgi:hypothetical protein